MWPSHAPIALIFGLSSLYEKNSNQVNLLVKQKRFGEIICPAFISSEVGMYTIPNKTTNKSLLLGNNNLGLNGINLGKNKILRPLNVSLHFLFHLFSMVFNYLEYCDLVVILIH